MGTGLVTGGKTSLKPAHHQGFCRAGVDRIDPDIIRCTFQRGIAHQANYRMFAGGVGTDATRALNTRGRRSHHNAAAAALAHGSKGILHGQPDALDVDGHDLVKHQLVIIHHRQHRALNTGIGEEDINTAIAHHSRGDIGLAGGGTGDIGGKTADLGTVNVCHHFIELVLLQVYQQYLRARGDKTFCRGNAYTAGATGNNRHFAC